MKVVLAHDGSPQADKALERVIQIAAKAEVELVVVNVAEDPCLPVTELGPEQCDAVNAAYQRERGKVMECVCGKLADKGIPTQTVVESGDPADKILETAAANGAELIVLGSKGRSGAARLLLGSVSGAVAAHATCDVLIVK